MDQCRWAQTTKMWDVRTGKSRSWRPKTRWAYRLQRVVAGQNGQQQMFPANELANT